MSMPFYLATEKPSFIFTSRSLYITNEIVIDIITMSCAIKVNSNTIELTVHTSGGYRGPMVIALDCDTGGRAFESETSL